MHKPYKLHCNNGATVDLMAKDRETAQKPVNIQMEGYEVIEKIAKPCANSARIIVPRDWIGKRVRVVRLDP